MSVIFDLQAIQSLEHGGRGIARYTLELACSLERWSPATIDRFLLNPAMTVPLRVGPLVAGGKLTYSDRVESRASSILHLSSPFELEDLDRLWPRFARRRGLALVSTVYDLIPLIFSEHYLTDPAMQRQYGICLELLRRSDRLHCISQCTANDVIERLGVAPERVVVVGAAPSPRFQRPASPEAARGAVRSLLALPPGDYILYVGGLEHRKNVDALLTAYAGLDEDLRHLHPLVIAYELPPGERARLEAEADRLGIADRLAVTGYVDDATLARLYQAATLFVFPSLYEGFGLPVAEAMACGTPVIAGRNSSLVELVQDDAALFDSASPQSLRETMERALTDPSLRERLLGVRLDQRYTWHSVVERTLGSYQELTPERRPARRRPQRPRIAYASPLPPMGSGVAEYSVRLLAELVRYCDIDVFVEDGTDEVEAPPGVDVFSLQSFERVEALRDGYHRVIFCIGNSSYHIGIIELLRRWGRGVVIAHDVRLVGLYAWCGHYRPEFVPGGFFATLQRAYAGRIPNGLGQEGGLDYLQADRFGILLAGEIISLSERFLAHSDYAANLARLDAAPEDDGKIGVVPFAFAARPQAEPGHDNRPVVASFGMVAPIKQSRKVIEAFGRLARVRRDVQLVMVGETQDRDAREYRCLAADLGVQDRVHLTGHVSTSEYEQWLQRSTVAVQLRDSSNGETSASVGDCLAAGVPTVVTDIGSADELPEECTLKVPRDIPADDLAAELGGLLDDDGRRAKMRQAALEFAAKRSFSRVAEVFYRDVIVG